MKKEIMLQRYDEDAPDSMVKIELSKAINNEVEAYRGLLERQLKAKKCYGSVEMFRRWKTSENIDVTVRFIIEPNEGDKK